MQWDSLRATASDVAGELGPRPHGCLSVYERQLNTPGEKALAARSHALQGGYTWAAAAEGGRVGPTWGASSSGTTSEKMFRMPGLLLPCWLVSGLSIICTHPLSA